MKLQIMEVSELSIGDCIIEYDNKQLSYKEIKRKKNIAIVSQKETRKRLDYETYSVRFKACSIAKLTRFDWFLTRLPKILTSVLGLIASCTHFDQGSIAKRSLFAF